MRSLRLKSINCSVSGELGLVGKGMKLTHGTSADNDGTLLAHDILEHQNGLKSIGSVGDEIEALGGVWFVRGQHGQLRRGSHHTPHDGVASDLSNLCEIYMRGVPMRVDVINTREHDCDVDFEDVIAISKNSNKWWIKDCENFDQKRYKEFYRSAIHILRTGYNKANRRFKSPEYAHRLFWDMSEAIGRACEFLEFEGQEFVLRYGNGEVTCREFQEEVY